MSLSNLQLKIRTLIGQDQLQQAVEELLGNIRPGDLYDALIIQSSKLYAIKKAFLEGRIDYQEEQKELNQMRVSLLELCGHLKEEDLKAVFSPQHTDNILESYQASVARITILWILIQNVYIEEGLTITELYTYSGLNKRKHVVKVLNELNETSNIKKFKKEKSVYWKLTERGRGLAAELLENAAFELRRKG